MQTAPSGTPSLWNKDLAPTDQSARTWAWYHYAALWVGMAMCIPAYMLASGLIAEGMSPVQAIATVFLGNAIVLVPMLLVCHAGAKYGVPFPVLARASFGVRGAAFPAIARALVACGWFGIQTFVGGSTLHALLHILTGLEKSAPLPLLGIGWSQLLCFLAFWALQMAIVSKGMIAIRRLETWTAPFKIAVCIALVWWALQAGNGLGSILGKESAFVAGGPKAGQFWAVFWPSLTAMVGFWATLALNIPDFTRFARTQGDQMVGQAIGLPLPMALMAVMSVITTSATVVVFGEAIWDPVALASRFNGVVVVLGLVVIAIDTACCNLAANVVSPAYDFSSLAPRLISYKTGAAIAALIGIIIMPWKLIESTGGYIFTWLIGYSALLGPLAAVLIVDYWLVRRRMLAVDDLYAADGAYRYNEGWNPIAFAAVALGVAPNIPGFLHAAAPGSFEAGSLWLTLYTYAWFVGFAVTGFVYAALTLMRRRPVGARAHPA